MVGLTVKDLLSACKEAVKEGYGDRVVMLSDDDEGNGYHTLFYAFTSDKDMLRYIFEDHLLHDDGYKPEDIIILG